MTIFISRRGILGAGIAAAMGVKFKSLAGGGGPDAATSFLDPFNRPNGNIGLNYVVGGIATFNVAGNQLNYATTTGIAGTECCVCLAANGLLGSLSQYVGITFISASAANRLGGAVYVAGNCLQGGVNSGIQAYYFHVFGATINLIAFNPIGFSYPVANGLGAGVAGDLFELQADIGTASNRVRLWQNGAVLADVTDNNAARPVSKGFPGFVGTGNVGAASIWDNLAVRASR